MSRISLETRPVVLTAPSGAGKTTIARTLVDGQEDFSFSVSATTRRPRESEVDGVDYWFLTRGNFRSMVERGELVEWAEVHGEYYGTPLRSLTDAASGKRHVVLDIDVQGARQIRETVPEALLLFILPPSADSLLERLVTRGTEDEEALRRRLETAVGELEAADFFDFFVVNRKLQDAVREVAHLVRAAEPPPAGTSGTLEDAHRLLEEIQSLLRREHLL